MIQAQYLEPAQDQTRYLKSNGLEVIHQGNA